MKFFFFPLFYFLLPKSDRLSINIIQAQVFSSKSGGCAAFLSNYNPSSAARVTFNNKHYHLPPWSISILPDCKNAVFNTAKVSESAIGTSLLIPSWFVQDFMLAEMHKFFAIIIAGWSSDIPNENVAH